jgi:AcrR family transcriptional regulator
VDLVADVGMPIWARPERKTRAVSSTLSQDQIVAAATKIADAEGLDAVSMRRVAGQLNAGAMSLYRYVSTKDDLLDLMLDGVMGEIVADVPADVSISSGDLRRDLQGIGYGLRGQIHEHPWLPRLMSGRPAFGPNMVRCVEIALSVFDGMDLDADTMMNAVGAINAFVYGFVQQELAEQETQRRTGISEPEWRARMGPYVSRLMDTGKYPRLKKVMLEGTDPEDHTVEFVAQLAMVVDGIIASLPAKQRQRKHPR